MIQLAPSLKIFMATCTSNCANCYYVIFAIRFAIEELPAELLPAELLPGARLEVDEMIFDRDEIRRLYDSEDYPLVRRVATR